MSRVFVRELGGYNRLPSRICGFSRSVSTAVSISRSPTACGAISIAGLDGSYHSK
jgi:hypothetical protein